MFYTQEKNLNRFKARRTKVIEQIKLLNPKVESGVLLLIADFESARHAFKQESSFYYLTGVTEPAVVMCCYFDGADILYMPFYGQNRDQWVKTDICLKTKVSDIAVDQIKYLGSEVRGYSSAPFFTPERYSEVIADIKKNIGDCGVIYTLMDSTSSRYFTQMQLIARFQDWLYDQKITIADVSGIVHKFRRTKENHEINLIYKAAQITSLAIQAAAKNIESGKYEYQIQAFIEYVFKESVNADAAFASIVATGKNTTILHCNDRNTKLHADDLVVVDIGAEYGFYSSDLTRTFPVAGKFSVRQKEVYDIVLQTQKHIESLAVPGMYLNNANDPKRSLHHQAVNFLDKHGYSKYFVHGIGHFLGLDVHDVGSNDLPLQPGDVFTIEPGLYIPEENIGIRIEDDYAMAEDGVVCLSADLPKSADDIENMMSK
ncbi:MAG: aminopeptidase P N-terminal domain-containing protein [Candidatus Babeliales bacterium]|jgi:Xaa-Pro aminopeptidase